MRKPAARRYTTRRLLQRPAGAATACILIRDCLPEFSQLRVIRIGRREPIFDGAFWTALRCNLVHEIARSHLTSRIVAPFRWEIGTAETPSLDDSATHSE